MKENKIGQRIMQRRKELEISQEELAKRMGYKSRSTINKIELGINDITQSKVKQFADALNVSPSWLMGWDDIEWDPSTQEIEEYGYYEDDDAKAYADFLFKNPEYKVLFDASKKVKAEDLQKAVTALGLFAKDDDVDG